MQYPFYIFFNMIPKKTIEIKEKTELDKECLKEYLTKRTKKVYTKDYYLEGIDAINKKAKYKEIKGNFDWQLARGINSRWENRFQTSILNKKQTKAQMKTNEEIYE